MNHWFCEPATALRIFEARERADVEAQLKAVAASSDDTSPKPSLLEGVMTIPVIGALTKKPDFWARIFGEGNTTYESLQSDLRSAAENPRVKSVVLAIDSPGGNVDGLFETLDLIASFPKPIQSVCESAQSAAYAIAAATGKIHAASRSASFGSIGTAVSYRIDANVVTLTNSESPAKRPDLKTEEGKAVVVEYLDQVNDLFVEAIAKGRKVPETKVRKGYGRGASFTAQHALEMGMIDSIVEQPKTRASAIRSQMDPVEAAALKAERDALVKASQEMSAQLAALTAQVAANSAQAEAAKLTAFVDKIQTEGKLPPALRAWALTQSLASLESFAAAAPAVAAVVATKVEAAATTAPTAPTAEDKLVCEQLGISEKDYLAEKAIQHAEAAARRAGSK